MEKLNSASAPAPPAKPAKPPEVAATAPVAQKVPEGSDPRQGPSPAASPTRKGLDAVRRPAGLELPPASGKPPEAKGAQARVDAAKGLATGGFQYDHGRPDAHHGVCTDFVATAVDRSKGQPDGTLEKHMNDYLKPKNGGDINNARNVNGQMSYWQAHPGEAAVKDLRQDPAKEGMKPGDLVYLFKPGTQNLRHVAMVTQVDEHGTPTEIAHAHGLKNDSSDAVDRGTQATVNTMDHQSQSYTEFHRVQDIAYVVRPAG